MYCRRPVPPPPPDLEELALWVRDRIREPNPHWLPRSAATRALPNPVNLPGMDKAAAAVLAKYRNMPVEWCGEVIQGFMGCWLLREETPVTIARSATSGVQRGCARSLEMAIAWKLRSEILSQAGRAYKRTKREADLFIQVGEMPDAALPLESGVRWMPTSLRDEEAAPSPPRRVDAREETDRSWTS